MKAEDYYKRIESKWALEYPSSTRMDEVWSFYKECGYEDPQETLGIILDKVEWRKRRVLDFGCDNGLMLNFICTRHTEVSGFGIDINSSAIKKAQKAFPDYEFQSFNGLKTEYESKMFDLVFVSAVMKHIRYEDRELVYQELNRVSDKVFFIEADSKTKEEVPHGSWTFYNSNFEEEFKENFEPIEVLHIAGDILGLYSCS